MGEEDADAQAIVGLDWLADQELRARVSRQLNKGEQLHALRRAIFYANEGHIRQRTPEQQSEQALCRRSSSTRSSSGTPSTPSASSMSSAPPAS